MNEDEIIASHDFSKQSMFGPKRQEESLCSYTKNCCSEAFGSQCGREGL